MNALSIIYATVIIAAVAGGYFLGGLGLGLLAYAAVMLFIRAIG